MLWQSHIRLPYNLRPLRMGHDFQDCRIRTMPLPRQGKAAIQGHTHPLHFTMLLIKELGCTAWPPSYGWKKDRNRYYKFLV